MMWTTLAGLLVAACSGQQYVPDSSDFLPAADLRAVELQRYWEAELPLPRGDQAASVTLLDGTLYVVTREGNVAATDAESGLSMWSYPLADRGQIILPPSHLLMEDGPGPVVLIAGKRVHVLDRLNGTALDRFDIDFPPASPAVGDARRIFVGSSDGHIYALRWNPAPRGRAIPVWRVVAQGPVRARPLYDGYNLFFASEGGDVYSCVAHNRVRNWERRNYGPILADLLVDETSVYIASADRSLCRLDREAGRTLWRKWLPLPLRDAPVVSEGTVFQPGPEGGLFAFEADSGQRLWHSAEADMFISRDGDVLYTLAAGQRQRLLVLDALSGDKHGALALPEVRIVVPNPAGDAIYLLSNDNRMVCLRPARVPYLTLSELAAIRARLRYGDQPAAAGDEVSLGESSPGESPADDPLRSRSNVAPVGGH